MDDCSTDKETLCLINDFLSKTNGVGFTNSANSGIKTSLLSGYEYSFSNGYDLVINLDSDAIVRRDFVKQLVDNYLPHTLLTGFHSITKNSNGTERHQIIGDNLITSKDTNNGIIAVDYPCYFKQSVGGINFCIDSYAYAHYVEPALHSPGNFDHNACIAAGGAYCLKESVIDHIGFDSSMGHIEEPDTAANFYFHKLPDVTLVCVDGRGGKWIEDPIGKSSKQLQFGDIMTIQPEINTIEQYSHYIAKELYHCIKTSHILIIQHDGYIINPNEWDDSWLQYDYIGATWWYHDGMNVGNGGFSLRSRRLMEIVATDPHITQYHPEDHHICRTYRKYLENTYGIKFAPEDVADKFSYEGYMQPHKSLGKQFGFHGKRNMRPRVPTGKRYVIGQFRGLGDILFLVPLVRALMEEGNEIIWPIDPEYISISKHFPDLPMVDMREVPIDYNRPSRYPTNYGEFLPYRFASELMHRSLRDCMNSKYELYRHDWKMWRMLSWRRDLENEQRLIDLIEAYGDYQLINEDFGAASSGMKCVIKSNPSLPIVKMSVIPGFTLIDWLGVIEGAKEIHTANTSIMYLLELMSLDIPVYVYPRGIWGERAFEYTRHLWENKCFKFVGE